MDVLFGGGSEAQVKLLCSGSGWVKDIRKGESIGCGVTLFLSFSRMT